MERDKSRIAEGLYHLGNLIVRIVGSMIFLCLAVFAFFYTHILLHWREIPVIQTDSGIANLAALIIAAGLLAVFMRLEKSMDEKHKSMIRRVTTVLSLIWIFTAGLHWLIYNTHRPWGDQYYIYGGASLFMEGDYHLLEPGEYGYQHPYQLGLIAIFEFIFLFAGAWNYHAYEIICLILAVGCVYCGYRILSEMTESVAIVVGYNILICGCLPLIFYIAWVYGEIPSIFFAMLAAWMMLHYARQKKNWCLVVLVISLVMAMLVRRNSLILLVAVGIVTFLYALLYKDRKLFAAFLAAVICSSASFGLINKMYEVRSGYEHNDGIPIIAWLAMGLQESNTENYSWYEGYPVYGWYNDYPSIVYHKTGFDPQKTTELAKENIQERLKVFMDDPAYMIMFFKEKVISQWNDPLYESVHFNWVRPEPEDVLEPNVLAARVGDVYYEIVLAMSDRWQFIVYVGMLCYFLFAVKKDSNILQHVLAVTIIGGVLYHALFEAKGRYAFPYYVMMYPYAMYGYGIAIGQAGKLAGCFRHFHKKREPVILHFEDSENKRKTG